MTEPVAETATPTQTTRTVTVRFIFLTLFMSTVLFLAAGRLDWWEGWTYVVVTMGILIASRVQLLKRGSDLLDERIQASQREDVKSWDRFLVPMIASIGPLLIWIVAGLDYRFRWSPAIPIVFQIVALAIMVVGTIIGEWSIHANRFFSSHVRLQSDRGHFVIKDGPYRFIRHPGYAGIFLVYLAIPFFFNSFWTGIPSALILIALVLRTSLEDQMLQDELTGYAEYTAQVRYRLFPGLW